MVLAVRDLGAGRPIVLLPWFGLDGGVTALAFEPVFAETTEWRRIYVDLPGTGGSAAVAPPAGSRAAGWRGEIRIASRPCCSSAQA